MTILKPSEDAFGAAMLHYLLDGGGFEAFERDDGVLATGPGPAIYFRPRAKWASHERRAMRFARGRVLDMACGAGRVALDLQERGLEVVGIDNSPGAIEACARLGLRDARLQSVHELSTDLGTFDTILLLGNTFGIGGTPEGTVKLLSKLKGISSSRGRIIAESLDPLSTDDPRHLRYHRENRKAGRWPGQVRIRNRYLEYATPWMDLLLTTPAELAQLAGEAGWSVRKSLLGDGGHHIAILEQKK